MTHPSNVYFDNIKSYVVNVQDNLKKAMETLSTIEELCAYEPQQAIFLIREQIKELRERLK